MKDSLKYFLYYKRKLIIKLRILYKRKHIDWDGYYYFALTRNQYNDYLTSINKKGRPKKNFEFQKIILYKIFDECNIAEHNRVAVFKIPVILDMGFTFYKENLKVSKPELVLEREPLKFSDILVTNYDYQIINNLK